MPYIVVSPLSQLQRQIALHRPSHVATLASGEAEPPGACEWLRLTFHDISAPREGLVAPQESHVERLIDFARGWDRRAPLLIHCYAGVSRSPAAAYVAALALAPELDPTALAQRLRALSPSATPNSRLVALGDALLGRGGRMTAAIEAIGRGAEAYEGEVFTLSLHDAG